MIKRETIRIHKAWKEIKPYLKKWQGRLSMPGADNIKTLGDFKRFYKSATAGGVAKSDLLVVRKLKSVLRFRTQLRTVRAIKQSGAVVIPIKKGKKTKTLKFTKGAIEDKTTRELRDMATRDIAEYFKNDIKEMYHALRKNGVSATDAGKEIASFYFGS